jgi:Protein of unknown function (DUF2510)
VRLLGRRGNEATQQEDPPPSQRHAVARAAWYPDPFGAAGERWWDGGKWTQEVRGAPRAGSGAPPRKRQVSALRRSAVEGRDADTALDSGRACTNCQGTGRVMFDTGVSGTCPVCLGKGRTTAEDRRIQLVLLAIFVAILVVAVVLRFH